MMMEGASGPARVLTIAATVTGGLGLACLFVFAFIGGGDVDALAGPLPLLETGIVLMMAGLAGFLLALAWEYAAGRAMRRRKKGKKRRSSRP